MSTMSPTSPFATIKVYHGYGHKDSLIVYGHVLEAKPIVTRQYTSNIVYNFINVVRLFFIRPVPGADVQLLWGNQKINSMSGPDGFFKFEWQSESAVSAGWHVVSVNLLDDEKSITATGIGKVFVPHSTQYGFISDIDDTVLVSHSASTGKKLRVLFTTNPRSRKTFSDVVRYYALLSMAHTEPEVPNPFFYVSSSEWNLYDYLNEFFKFNGLPKGVFLLNDIKRWYQLLKTGKTKHKAKLEKVARLLDVFPKQKFVLLGDNSQSDPEIYAATANQYPERIVAIYLRNIAIKKEASTRSTLESIKNKDIPICLFAHTDDAIQHSRSIRLIME